MKESFLLNSTEQEVVALLAALNLINGTINYEVLEIPREKDSFQVGFKSNTHLNFFSIMLVDFLSKPDSTAFSLEDSYLELLSGVVANPLLATVSSVEELSRSLTFFRNWVNTITVYPKAWFPSINQEIDLKIKRYDLLKIYGTVSKHNFTRLTRVADSLKLIFENNGQQLNLHQSLSIIDEFCEQVQAVILYHATTIAFAMNELRWGIYYYLRTTYKTALVQIDRDPLAYRYNYPNEIVSQFGQDCFWDLMNKVRSPPYVPRFKVPDHLSDKYY